MDEIDEFVNRIKCKSNLLRAIEAVEKRAECLKNGPPEFRPIPAEPVGEPPIIAHTRQCLISL
ncbi:unnamed protein product [Ceratitis capitata]|uniref:(Mediterranean fruit fly) hypothetical protein n=1 Tax=Ceratitis capitata TaxID=7213 RepID=A0A811VMP1_CERCA|nr:unnamed protein product [Ceratitis capitata]